MGKQNMAGGLIKLQTQFGEMLAEWNVMVGGGAMQPISDELRDFGDIRWQPFRRIENELFVLFFFFFFFPRQSDSIEDSNYQFTSLSSWQSIQVGQTSRAHQWLTNSLC